MMKYLTYKTFLAVLTAVLFTWLLHEFAHWGMSELLGYDTIMQLNTTYTLDETSKTLTEKILISGIGPLITLLQAIVCYMLLLRKWNTALFPFLFVPLYMRFLAGAMNFIHPNDEGRIGLELGMGKFTLSLAICVCLGLLVYRIVKNYQLSARFIWTQVILTMLLSSILILTDQFFQVRLL